MSNQINYCICPDEKCLTHAKGNQKELCSCNHEEKYHGPLMSDYTRKCLVDGCICQVWKKWTSLQEHIITNNADGTFTIDFASSDGSYGPKYHYKDAESCARRVLQLMGIKKPIEPQNWPERLCIGEIETKPDDGED